MRVKLTRTEKKWEDVKKEMKGNGKRRRMIRNEKKVLNGISETCGE